MNKFMTNILATLLASTVLVSTATAETVNVFAPDPNPSPPSNNLPPIGPWYQDGTKNGGSATIVDLAGEGGNLQNSAPMGTGVVKLTTGLTNSNEKAQVTVSGIFGSLQDFISGGSVEFDFYKTDISGGNPSAAASIKLNVYDFNTTSANKSAIFIYEHYLNYSAPTVDTWIHSGFSGTMGDVWSFGGIYGAASGQGILKTMLEWSEFLNSDFLNATIVGISVGVGSGNLGQEAYFDKVTFNSGKPGENDLLYDFEVGVPQVPVPTALPLFGTGLALMGFVGWRKKRKKSS